MRYHLQTAFLATVCLAFCGQFSRMLADEPARELIERLQPLARWTLDGDQRIVLDDMDRYLGVCKGGVNREAGVTGAEDGARSFDGQDGCVVVRHRDALLLDQGSLATWVRAADVERAQGVISKDSFGFGDGGHLTISIGQGQIAVRLRSTTESYELRAGIHPHRWTHIAFTFGSEGMQFYLDGQLVGKHAYTGGLAASSGGSGNREPLVFGASTMTSQSGSELPLSNFFRGDLDEVLLFSRQLAAREIAELVDTATPQYRSLARAYVANQPASWWRLDEPAGNTVTFDQAGNQHGTYHIVGAPHFDGNDHVDLGTFDLDNDAFTLLAIVEPASLATSGARILAKENELQEADQFWSLSTTLQEDHARLRFRLRTEHGMGEVVASDRELTLNDKVFVAAVYDGRTMRLYQDGELVGQVAQHGRPAPNSHCHVWIDDSPAGSGKRPFVGEIRDVAVLREALSPAQLRAIDRVARGSTEAVAPTELADPAAAPAESLPQPLASEPPHAAAEPFVHRCPLCDLRYREVLVRRVKLPGIVEIPVCGDGAGTILVP